MNDLARIVAAQAREMEEQRRRSRGRSREGRVVAVDEGAGLFRVDIGREGNAFLTPWIKAESLAAGGVQIQAEPVMGQHVRVTSESGDLTDAVIALSSFDDGQRRPHGKVGELKIVCGGTVITGTPDGLVLESNGSVVTINGSGVAIEGSAVEATGGSLTHNGTNVGDDHEHTGVTSGSSDTGTPK